MGETTRQAALVVARLLAAERETEGKESDLWKDMENWTEKRLGQWILDNSKRR